MLNEQTLIPDPSSRPWPKPIEYVYVAWGMLVVFGPMMVLFWLLGDEPTSPASILLTVAFVGSLILLVMATTAWTARRNGASLGDVTRAVRVAAPHRLRRDYLGRRK